MRLHTENKRFSTFDFLLMAIMIASGIVLQIVDGMISFGIPGGKLGLANIVSVLNIFIFGFGNAFLISILRATLGCLICGGISAIPYSVFGAAASVFVMAFIKKFFYPRVSEIGISVAGASVHNIAQIAVACLIFENFSIISYGGVLVAVGIFSGIVTGVSARELNKKFLKRIKNKK